LTRLTPTTHALQESQALGLPFEGVDLAAPLQRLHVGDEVEFRVALDRRTGQLKATEVSDFDPPSAVGCAGGCSFCLCFL
jgi:hypothetical protein